MLLVLTTFGLSCPLLGVLVFMAAVLDMAVNLAILEIYTQISPRCGQVPDRVDFGIDCSSLEMTSVGTIKIRTIAEEEEEEIDEKEERASVANLSTLAGYTKRGQILPALKSAFEFSEKGIGDGKGRIDGDVTGGLARACEGAREAAESVAWLVAVISSMYWAVMVFDMVGDRTVNQADKKWWAWAFAAATLVTPIIVWSGVNYFRAYHARFYG